MHPFDDPAIVAGQGSLGLELLEDVPDLAKVVIPVGGGGLCAGVALAIKAAKPDVQIVGVQAAACAPFPQSMQAGEPIEATTALTIADGIAVKRPGGITLPLLTELTDEIVVVGEDETAEAMALLLERCKLVVEGAGAVGVAALLGGQVKPAEHGVTVAILCGGNIDAGLLAAIARRHENESGRRLVLLTRVPDRPGALARILATVAGTGANIVDVSHMREGLDLHVRETAVEMVLETRGHDHAQRVLGDAERRGVRGAGPALRDPDCITPEGDIGASERPRARRRCGGHDVRPLAALVVLCSPLVLATAVTAAPAAAKTKVTHKAKKKRKKVAREGRDPRGVRQHDARPRRRQPRADPRRARLPARPGPLAAAASARWPRTRRSTPPRPPTPTT